MVRDDRLRGQAKGTTGRTGAERHGPKTTSRKEGVEEAQEVIVRDQNHARRRCEGQQGIMK